MSKAPTQTIVERLNCCIAPLPPLKNTVTGLPHDISHDAANLVLPQLSRSVKSLPRTCRKKA